MEFTRYYLIMMVIIIISDLATNSAPGPANRMYPHILHLSTNGVEGHAVSLGIIFSEALNP